MAHVLRSVLVAHSAQKMFDLVANVDQYPKFLPWCSASRAESHGQDQILASVTIDFKGLKQTFTTLNTMRPVEAIELVLKNGPFTHLNGGWKFAPLSETACEVQFELNYQFAAGLLGPLLTPIFDAIAGSLIDAFVSRAESLYGDEGQ
jgi:ribosome-associated toxin RatA of RatAB toxin-antitoxin module